MRKQFTKYTLVGGTAFAVEFLSFCLFFYVINLNLTIANGVSFLIGLLTSFVLNRSWTFSPSGVYTKKVHHQFVLYSLLAVINLFLTIALVNVFYRHGLEVKTSKLSAMLLTSGWNFMLFKWVIFKYHAFTTEEAA